MDDEYIKERSADIRDISSRIMRILKGSGQPRIEGLHEPVIVIAEDLVPSDIQSFNSEPILGFITELGGVYSHVSIIARNLELPALVGVENLLSSVHTNDFIILDAFEGKLIINPDATTIEKYKSLKKNYQRQNEALEALSSLPATTIDGRSIRICANASSLKEVKKAVAHHIDGIGLFRSEFLYMESDHFPTEEEQFFVYKEAAILCGKEIIIRTLDIGGDKALSYYTFDKEDNPFLGWRGIRISLELKDIFKTQLRAILRASAHGNVKIMYPMIVAIEELMEAKELLNQCKTELIAKNIPFDTNIKVGIMVETPAAVMCIHSFARHVDFFSIGTNDLTQYLLVADRGNKKLISLYNSFQPAVIQSLKHIIDAAHENNIEVGICGEFAADEKATLLLLGLGIDHFSIVPASIASIKNLIRNSSYEEAKELAATALKAATIQEVMDCL